MWQLSNAPQNSRYTAGQASAVEWIASFAKKVLLAFGASKSGHLALRKAVVHCHGEHSKLA